MSSSAWADMFCVVRIWIETSKHRSSSQLHPTTHIKKGGKWWRQMQKVMWPQSVHFELINQLHSQVCPSQTRIVAFSSVRSLLAFDVCSYTWGVFPFGSHPGLGPVHPSLCQRSSKHGFRPHSIIYLPWKQVERTRSFRSSLAWLSSHNCGRSQYDDRWLP